MPLSVIILAAGQGTRMRSESPKVLHQIGGRPMLAHVVATARALDARRIVVVHGPDGAAVRQALPDAEGLDWVDQGERLGTGHACQRGLTAVGEDDTVLVLYGDVPLVRATTLAPLAAEAAAGRIALLTAELADPTGYGRILRDSEGRVQGIVEEKDATPEQRHLREINTGLLAAPGARLKDLLGRIDNRNAQGEYYLTDIVALAAGADQHPVAVPAPDPAECEGINDRAQLARAERRHCRRQADALMAEGVTFLDPARVDIRGDVTAGRDVTIDVGVILEGTVTLGDGAYVGPYCHLRDSALGPAAAVESHSVLDGAVLEDGAHAGPFARLRPGTALAAGARVGNFVETKNSAIGPRSKVNHLSYIGDTEMGQDVNIGAGTITCNYDGARKHRTRIGHRAFIGSDTQLVAPVTVGDGATIGAGSTITRDAPAETLTLSRSQQTSVPGWERPTKDGARPARDAAAQSDKEQEQARDEKRTERS